MHVQNGFIYPNPSLFLLVYCTEYLLITSTIFYVSCSVAKPFLQKNDTCTMCKVVGGYHTSNINSKGPGYDRSLLCDKK